MKRGKEIDSFRTNEYYLYYYYYINRFNRLFSSILSFVDTINSFYIQLLFSS